jgi:deazaflavin-dependent oxidoreductase (nitroreductase family)
VNASEPRYVKPKSATNFFNQTIARFAKMGISVYGSRILYVRGRKSGQWRSTPVNPMTLDGTRYLVSPRGNTEWVRNLRATGYTGELHLGRRVEHFRATEVADEAKPAVLRVYLKRWAWEVGSFFEPGINAKSSDETLLGVAAGYPVFRIDPADA